MAIVVLLPILINNRYQYYYYKLFILALNYFSTKPLEKDTKNSSTRVYKFPNQLDITAYHTIIKAIAYFKTNKERKL